MMARFRAVAALAALALVLPLVLADDSPIGTINSAGKVDGATWVTPDATGTTLFVAVPQENKIKSFNLISKELKDYAGTGASGSSNGALYSATFDKPTYLAFFPYGKDLFVADVGTKLIRKIDTDTNTVSAYGGGGSSVPSASGVPATSAKFDKIDGMAIGFARGLVFVADGPRIVMIDTQQRAVLLKDLSADYAKSAFTITSMAYNFKRNILLYTANYPNEATHDKVFALNTGQATSALFVSYSFDGSGRLVETPVETFTAGEDREILKTTNGAHGIAVDSFSGTVYVAAPGENKIYRVLRSGKQEVLASGLPFNGPIGLALHRASGHLFAIDNVGNVVDIVAQGVITGVSVSTERVQEGGALSIIKGDVVVITGNNLNTGAGDVDWVSVQGWRASVSDGATPGSLTITAGPGTTTGPGDIIVSSKTHTESYVHYGTTVVEVKPCDARNPCVNRECVNQGKNAVCGACFQGFILPDKSASIYATHCVPPPKAQCICPYPNPDECMKKCGECQKDDDTAQAKCEEDGSKCKCNNDAKTRSAVDGFSDGDIRASVRGWTDTEISQAAVGYNTYIPEFVRLKEFESTTQGVYGYMRRFPAIFNTYYWRKWQHTVYPFMPKTMAANIAQISDAPVLDANTPEISANAYLRRTAPTDPNEDWCPGNVGAYMYSFATTDLQSVVDTRWNIKWERWTLSTILAAIATVLIVISIFCAIIMTIIGYKSGNEFILIFFVQFLALLLALDIATPFEWHQFRDGLSWSVLHFPFTWEFTLPTETIKTPWGGHIFSWQHPVPPLEAQSCPVDYLYTWFPNSALWTLVVILGMIAAAIAVILIRYCFSLERGSGRLGFWKLLYIAFQMTLFGAVAHSSRVLWYSVRGLVSHSYKTPVACLILIVMFLWLIFLFAGLVSRVGRSREIDFKEVAYASDPALRDPEIEKTSPECYPCCRKVGKWIDTRAEKGTVSKRMKNHGYLFRKFKKERMAYLYHPLKLTKLYAMGVVFGAFWSAMGSNATFWWQIALLLIIEAIDLAYLFIVNPYVDTAGNILDITNTIIEMIDLILIGIIRAGAQTGAYWNYFMMGPASWALMIISFIWILVLNLFMYRWHFFTRRFGIMKPYELDLGLRHNTRSVWDEFPTYMSDNTTRNVYVSTRGGVAGTGGATGGSPPRFVQTRTQGGAVATGAAGGQQSESVRLFRVYTPGGATAEGPRNVYVGGSTGQSTYEMSSQQVVTGGYTGGSSYITGTPTRV
eukprot:tig00021589_g22739.t1